MTRKVSFKGAKKHRKVMYSSKINSYLETLSLPLLVHKHMYLSICMYITKQFIVLHNSQTNKYVSKRHICTCLDITV